MRVASGTGRRLVAPVHGTRKAVGLRETPWRGVLIALVAVGLFVGPADAKDPRRAPLGPLITLYLPHAQRFELALDEVELAWEADGPGASSAATAREVAGARLAARDDRRAVFFLTGIRHTADLKGMALALRGANPAAEVHLVLYKPGLPESPASRLLLTRRLSLILGPGEDPAGLLAGRGARAVEPVPGVPGGFVVEAVDPLSALDLANALRQQPGVQSAVPLLERLRYPR